MARQRGSKATAACWGRDRGGGGSFGGDGGCPASRAVPESPASGDLAQAACKRGSAAKRGPPGGGGAHLVTTSCCAAGSKRMASSDGFIVGLRHRPSSWRVTIKLAAPAGGTEDYEAPRNDGSKLVGMVVAVYRRRFDVGDYGKLLAAVRLVLAPGTDLFCPALELRRLFWFE